MYKSAYMWYTNIRLIRKEVLKMMEEALTKLVTKLVLIVFGFICFKIFIFWCMAKLGQWKKSAVKRNNFNAKKKEYLTSR